MTAIDRLDKWLRISPSTVLPAEVLEYLDDIKAENAKLQEEMELVGTAGYLLAMKQLKTENEKLRKKINALKAHGIEIVDAVAGGYEIYDTSQREVDRLEVESEKLRAERDEWHRVAESKQNIIDHMRDANTENTKLLELVRAFDWCTENFDMTDKCEHCPLSQSDALNPECEVRMRKLGIEVLK